VDTELTREPSEPLQPFALAIDKISKYIYRVYIYIPTPPRGGETEWALAAESTRRPKDIKSSKALESRTMFRYEQVKWPPYEGRLNT
jgi:hypothetical protein